MARDAERPRARGPALTRRRLLAGVGAASAVGATGCVAPSSNGGSPGGTPTVTATLTDYDVVLSRETIPAGAVTFDVWNEADQVHEFVLFATDLAADALPTDDDEVEEDAPGLALVDEVEDVEGGERARLAVDLDPGHYAAICNLPEHYELGMHAGVVVE